MILVEKPTLKELYIMQETVTSLEATLKMKREEFLDACHQWYSQERQKEYCDISGYELHWIPLPVRSIVAAKLKQDMPSTYNLIVKESINLIDAEKALGSAVERYITTRTTFSPKVIVCPGIEIPSAEGA
jgi:predicted nucleic-acid-binding protein